MIRLWGILFGLAVAVVAGLMVQATFAKATEKFRGHVEAGSDDFKLLHSTDVSEGAQHNHGAR